MSTSTLSPDRQTWREAVADIADKAHEKLPECNGRIDRAVKLVLAGDVELLADGTARVASQSNGMTQYHIANGVCTCEDFAKAPHGFCTHRLSAAIARRAAELIPMPEEPVVQEEPAGEIVPGIDPRHITIISGKPFVKFSGLLAMAHAKGLQELKTEWTYNDADLSLATATATFPFGVFRDGGDATKANVNRKVEPHFRRCALTRASARCLRLALGVELVAVEEICGEEVAHA